MLPFLVYMSQAILFEFLYFSVSVQRKFLRSSMCWHIDLEGWSAWSKWPAHAEKNRANNLECTCTSSGVLLVHLVTLSVILPNERRTIRDWKLGGYREPQVSNTNRAGWNPNQYLFLLGWRPENFTTSPAKHFAACTICKDWSSRLRRMNKPFAKWMWVIPSSWHLGWKENWPAAM